MATSSSTKIVVVGCGPWGSNLAQSLTQEGALGALVDVLPSRAAELSECLSARSSHCTPVCSFEDVLVDPSIDGVVLATPAPQHADMAVAALTAGKHVFVEKPLALSVEDSKRVVAAGEAADKLVMVGHLFQYHPAFVELKRMVQQGELGQLQHIHSRRLNFGRIRQEEDVFWNLGAHDISMILELANDMPEGVTAKGFHHLRKDVADAATAELSFSSGLQAHVLVSWLFPQKERKLIVVGDVATAVFDDCEPWEKKLRLFRNHIRWSDGVPQTVEEGSETIALKAQAPLAVECKHFLECVRNGRQPYTNGEEALRVVKVLELIGQQVQQDESRSPGISSTNNRTTLRLDGLSPHSAINGKPQSNGTKTHTTQLVQGEALDLSAASNHVGSKSTTDMIPLVDLTPQRVRIQDQLELRIAKVLNHTNFILGPEVRELESKLAEYSGAAHVVTCGSGTDALTLSLLALGLQRGDAVLVPDLSFVATVEPIVLLGGIPIFVDVQPQCLTIDPSLIDAGVAAATKAGYRAKGVIAVDLYGHPADYNRLNEAAARHGLWIIGDAAQSFGGSLNGRRVGSLARLSTTSFFPSKPLGSYGDGGAVFTNDGELAQLLRSLRQHGLDKTKSNSLRIGLNSRLDTIQAAVLLCKLELLAEEVKLRETVAQRYSKLLHGAVVLPATRDSVCSGWATYTVRTTQRDVVKQYLHDHGIASAICYGIPFHKQEAYRQFPVIEGSCPVAERACKEVLSLPMGPYIDITAQSRIAKRILEALVQLN